MSQWGWSPARNLGIWRYGAPWMRPVIAAVPYVTVGLLLLMFHFVGGTLTTSKGVLFDLPACGVGDGEKTDMVALVMPVSHDTMVFFDDTRYLLGDPASLQRFGASLAERVEREQKKSLLLLSDSRISSGRLLELVAEAKRNGVSRVLVAGNRQGGGSEP